MMLRSSVLSFLKPNKSREKKQRSPTLIQIQATDFVFLEGSTFPVFSWAIIPFLFPPESQYEWGKNGVAPLKKILVVSLWISLNVPFCKNAALSQSELSIARTNYSPLCQVISWLLFWKKHIFFMFWASSVQFL